MRRFGDAVLETLLHGAPIGFAVLDPELRFVLVNDKLAEMNGLPPAEHIGRHVAEVVPDLATAAADVTAQIRDTGEPVLDREFTGATRAAVGEIRWWKESWYPVRGQDGTLLAFGAIVEDITERKRAEGALRDSEERLRMADRRKDEFLATLAHELRNPLTPLRNGIGLLQRALTSDTQLRRTVDLMDRQLTHLVRLVDDLLDVGRISAGKIELRRTVFSIGEAVDASVEASRVLIDAHHHQLVVERADEEAFVEGDFDRLSQVFSNLLCNAAKYTEDGGRITVTVRRNGAEAAVQISDTGVGIPPQELPRIFDLFSQVRTHQERAAGGLGIGLALVKRIVALHGGRVVAESGGPGAGSKFTVRLPLAKKSLP
ncbi:MAG TPA: PAS domain-containing sensor histidine kinase [Burkholderiales bacterium]|nr:PAS domain-containing sensor histidine kinase [Burkholderiales bacterium]